MNTFQELIAEILRKHRFERCSTATPGDFKWWGRCIDCGAETHHRTTSYVGWELDMRDAEAFHAASLITKALSEGVRLA